MIRSIKTAALAMVLALGLANAASAAFVQADATPIGDPDGTEFLVEVFLVVEQDQNISTVDVGIEVAGGIFSNISTDDGNGGDSFFVGAFLGPGNAIQQNGAVAVFSGSALQGKAADALVPVSLGTVTLTLAGRDTDNLVILSGRQLYQINAVGGNITGSTPDTGDVLATINAVVMVPEPTGLALLGLALAGLSLRRRA